MRVCSQKLLVACSTAGATSEEMRMSVLSSMKRPIAQLSVWRQNARVLINREQKREEGCKENDQDQ